jgi:hypothetical protein
METKRNTKHETRNTRVRNMFQNTTGETFQKLIGCVNRVGFLNEKEFVAMVYSAWMLGMGPNPLGSDDGGDGERKGEAEAEGEGEKKSSIGSKDDQTTVATTTTTTTTTTSKEETNATSDQDNAATASDATTATYHNQNETFDKIFHTYSLGTRFIDISNSSQFPSRNIESVMADLLGKLRTKPTLTADLLPAKLTTMSLRSQNRGISKLELAIFVNALNQVKREPWDEHINNCDQVVLWKFQLTSVQLYQTLLLNTFDERIASVAAPLTMPVAVAARPDPNAERCYTMLGGFLAALLQRSKRFHDELQAAAMALERHETCSARRRGATARRFRPVPLPLHGA